jgi:hypothetical protein
LGSKNEAELDMHIKIFGTLNYVARIPANRYYNLGREIHIAKSKEHGGYLHYLFIRRKNGDYIRDNFLQ